MQLFFGVVAGLLALVFLVVIHELGHALAAIHSGVVVEEFGVGMPPRAWKKKLKNGILLTINWLPLGGFVKLKGEHDSASQKGDYGAAGYFRKTKILLAGVVFNWLLAIVILSILAITGLPKIIDGQFSLNSDTNTVNGDVTIIALSDNHSAVSAGFEIGDKVIKFADKDIKTVDDLINQAKLNKGQLVSVDYKRDGVLGSKQVQLGSTGQGGYFGAGLGQAEYTKSTWSAPITGVVVTGQLTAATFQGLGDMISNLFNGLIMQFSSDDLQKNQAADDLKSVGDSVAGPIGILGVIFPQAQQAGLTQFFLLVAIVSISLAAMNILPIPALDGGRWLLMTIHKLINKPLTKEREEKIQFIGFSILMALVILVTILDVKKIL